MPSMGSGEPLFSPVSEIEASDAREFVDERRPEEYTLLDVRQPAEYEQSHLPGALLIPLTELQARFGEVPRGRPVLCYCEHGGRSWTAALFLGGRGYSPVWSIRGGVDAWEGQTAVGPPEWGLSLVSVHATPAEATTAALALERGLGRFYQSMCFRCADAEAAALFRRLAEFESYHEAKVERIRLNYGGDDQEVPEGLLEGGFRAEDLFRQAEALGEDPKAILGLAMAIEAQAMDLYLRLAASSEMAETKRIWEELGGDEKEHLTWLGELLDRRAGGAR